MELPVVNTRTFQGTRRDYNLDGGSRGLNVIKSVGRIPVVVAYISDTGRYDDHYEIGEVGHMKYEFEDQEKCVNGRRKRFSKPFNVHGPVGMNRKILSDLRSWNNCLPTVLIGKFGPNRWGELYADCVLTGWSLGDNEKPFFHIQRSRVPRWHLSGPNVGEVDEE